MDWLLPLAVFRKPKRQEPESNGRIGKAHPAKTGAECGTRS